MSEPQMPGTIEATLDASRSSGDTTAAVAAPSAVTAAHDLTGDGRADIAGFWGDGVYVAATGVTAPSHRRSAPSTTSPPAPGGVSTGTPASSQALNQSVETRHGQVSGIAPSALSRHGNKACHRVRDARGRAGFGGPADRERAGYR